MNKLKLENKVVVVTGGNSGIGLATACLCRAEGASVVIVGQNTKTLEDARQELGGDTLEPRCQRIRPFWTFLTEI